MKRVFLAVNLPANIRYELEAVAAELNFPDWMRPIDPRDWHITVLFFGEQSEGDVEKIKMAIRGEIYAIKAPDIKLEKIEYGPMAGESRMIWAKTDSATSQGLGAIQKKISDLLRGCGVGFKMDHPGFNGHITLAKFGPGKRLPAICEPLDLEFKAGSLDLMESHLANGNSGYEILEKFKFGVE